MVMQVCFLKLNAYTLRIAQRGGNVTEEEVTEELKDITEENRRELLKLFLKEERSTIPRACKDLFWNMAKVLYLFYLKDDGFVSNELLSTVRDVLEKPIVLHESSEHLHQLRNEGGDVTAHLVLGDHLVNQSISLWEII
ncbi:hypothetical protein K1719_013804 [Acacia pycnantha]|nr:hypothetical protein K1719_013804 [Acacia pycnantha]